MSRPARLAAFISSIVIGVMAQATVPAYVLDDYMVVIYPSDDSTREILTFTILNDQEQALQEGNYTIGGDISNLKVSDSRGLLQSSTTSLGDSSLIVFQYRNPIQKGGSNQITISFECKGLLGKSTFVTEGIRHEDRVINTAFFAPSHVNMLRVRVHLPEGAWLPRSLSDQATIVGSPLQPMDGSIVSNGTSLSILWERRNLSKGDRFDLFVAYTFPGVISKIQLFLALLMLAVGLAAGGLSTFFFARRKASETTSQRTLALLEEGERRVLKTIMEVGGEIRQDELMRTTGYSKARVSQLVTHLEKLGLIRKERYERTNKLFLTEEIREA